MVGADVETPLGGGSDAPSPPPQAASTMVTAAIEVMSLAIGILGWHNAGNATAADVTPQFASLAVASRRDRVYRASDVTAEGIALVGITGVQADPEPGLALLR